ncbi:MAG: NYN domain-containing protein [Kiritimatiellae bacterium]|nr:NYN domain-containing protein [Kiritimatiellia bacterium]
MQRTFIYIDGFNLFHGALRHTSYKWLDPRAMVSSLIGTDKVIASIKYFTARVTPRANDPGQPFRQHMYLRALLSIGVQLVFGRYLSHVTRMYKAHQKPGEDPFVEVVKTEEKGTDVNIATHMVTDAADNLFDCAILVSGDSDLTAPVKVCIGKYGKIVGVLNPQRQKCRALESAATFYKHIRESVLAGSQFPTVLSDAQGSFHKPPEW